MRLGEKIILLLGGISLIVIIIAGTIYTHVPSVVEFRERKQKVFEILSIMIVLGGVLYFLYDYICKKKTQKSSLQQNDKEDTIKNDKDDKDEK